jgi:hypothetical protein
VDRLTDRDAVLAAVVVAYGDGRVPTGRDCSPEQDAAVVDLVRARYADPSGVLEMLFAPPRRRQLQPERHGAGMSWGL